MAMRDFEAAQAEAMELLLQQCVDGSPSDLQRASPPVAALLRALSLSLSL